MTDPASIIQALWRWYCAELARLYRDPASPTGIILGCPLWGRSYVERFGRYCLSTICADANLQALAGRARIVIATDQESWLDVHRMLAPLEPWGIGVQILLLPPEAMAATLKSTNARYAVLGTVQNLLLRLAARSGAGFHMLQPDHVYNHRYFRSQGELSALHSAILQTSVSSDIRTAAKDIEAYRRADSELEIPDRDLGDIGWRHLHQRIRVYRMNEARFPDLLPHSHYLLWQARDFLRIHCCDMNVSWLAPQLCAAAPVPSTGRQLVSTMDTRLPALVPGEFFVPNADSGMTFIEVSDGSQAARPKYVDGKEFSATCWRQVRYSDSRMRFFARGCEVPIAEQDDYLTDEEIAAQHRQIVDFLHADRARVAILAAQAQAEAMETPLNWSAA